jgi:hypothetical protein
VQLFQVNGAKVANMGKINGFAPFSRIFKGLYGADK